MDIMQFKSSWGSCVMTVEEIAVVLCLETHGGWVRKSSE